MRKSDKIEEAVMDIALWGTVIWGGIAIISHIARTANKGTSGIGKVERIKRRVYKEVSLAQDAGVDFSKKYHELTKAETDALEHIGKDVVEWKQSKRSIESGKPYTESYYNSLRRAWNAVSGVQGIGRAYNVKDANGNVCLTWIEDAAAHVEAERRTLEAEERAAAARKRLAKARSSQAAPVEQKSKQQLILDMFPYLKTHDADGEPRVTDRFNYVIWRVIKNTNTGDTSLQGPAMAFMTREAAMAALKELKHFSGKGQEKFSTVSSHYSIKHINQVKLDGLFGIGYAPEVEAELFEIWREQIEYGNTECDYETWREIYGDEFARTDVIPYM